MNIVVDGNNIFSIDIYGARECIGVTAAAYKEMQKAAELATEKAEEFYNLKEEYFEKLVENGILTRPKTQEDINAELMDQNRILMEVVVSLKEKMESRGVEHGLESDEIISPKNGDKRGKTRPNNETSQQLRDNQQRGVDRK